MESFFLIAAIVALLIGWLLLDYMSGQLPSYDPWPLRSGQILWINGRKYRILGCDAQAAHSLTHAANRWHDRRHAAKYDTPPLIEQRQTFRQIIRDKPIRALIWSMTSSNVELQLLGIWLLGRCSTKLGITAIASHRKHRDPAVRRQVAKALRRMGAWCELASMAESDPDPHVRQIAKPETPEPFTKRFSEFAASGIAPLLTTPALAPKPLVWNVGELGQGHPPKPAWWIRQILERIHRLLRG